MAPPFGVELRAIGVRDAGEIERAITGFARSSNGGLIMTGSPLKDRADRQRAVAFASPERSELGINDEVAAPHPPGPTY